MNKMLFFYSKESNKTCPILQKEKQM